MIDKLLQKNIQLSYRWLGRLNQHRDRDQDSLYRSELKRFLQTLTDSVKGKRILDLGSGSWSWTKETFSPLCDFVSFDITAHANVDVVGDLYCLHETFPGEPSFDAVIATDVFEHVAWPAKALQQVSCVLRPKGLFIASTPFKKNLHGEEYGDYWRITRQGWHALLTENGFDRISISWLGEEQFPIAYFVHAQKKMPPTQTKVATTNAA